MASALVPNAAMTAPRSAHHHGAPGAPQKCAMASGSTT
jgi:hypothetical protein